MTPEVFEQLVEEGIEAIPEKFLKLVNNVAIVIEEEPTLAQRHKIRLGKGHTLLGLYEGVPQTGRSRNYSGVLPDKITIFRKPILAFGHTPEGIRQLVADTVWHEIAHHFGMDEHTVRTAEGKRKRKNH